MILSLYSGKRFERSENPFGFFSSDPLPDGNGWFRET